MFPFDPPPGFDLLPVEAEILRYIEAHPGEDYEAWPRSVRLTRTVEAMRRKHYIRRKYFPTRYYLTRSGTSLTAWLKTLSEHRSAS